MVQRTGGARRKTRYALQKEYREKGKTQLRKHLQEFDEGDSVILKADPSVQSGMYNMEFHGDIGIVVGEQGKCYKVQVEDGNMTKTFIVHPVHLKKVKE